MSILIKNMEMPKNEELIIICSDGTVEMTNNDGSRICEQKAIELPSHGRLIDADTLTVKHGWLDNFDNTHTHIQFVYANEINRTPTIIESEKEVKDG